MSRKLAVGIILALGALSVVVVAARSGASRAPLVPQHEASVEHGRYLVRIAGCNDCHTPGYAQAGGKVREVEWLTGDTLGWRGPWGTTYAPNLRLYMNGMTEAQWVARAKALETRPPMPWFVLHDMTEDDLRSIYRYVRHLGPAGVPAPAYLAAGSEPGTPYVQFPAPPR